MVRSTAQGTPRGETIQIVTAWYLTIRSLSRGWARAGALLAVASLAALCLFQLPILADRSSFDAVSRVEATTPVHGLVRSGAWTPSQVLSTLRAQGEVDQIWALAFVQQVVVRNARTNATSVATLVGYDDAAVLTRARGVVGVCPLSPSPGGSDLTMVSAQLAAALDLATPDPISLTWMEPTGRQLSLDSTVDGCLPLDRSFFIPILSESLTDPSFVFIPMALLEGAFSTGGEALPMGELVYPFWFSPVALSQLPVRAAMELLISFQERVTPPGGEVLITLPLLVALNNALGWESGFQLLLIVIGVPVAYVALLSFYAVVVTESRVLALYRETLESRHLTYRGAALSFSVLCALCAFGGALTGTVALTALFSPNPAGISWVPTLGSTAAFSSAFGLGNMGVALVAVREAGRIDPSSRGVVLPPPRRADLILVALGLGSFLFLVAAQLGLSAPSTPALAAVYGLVQGISLAILPLAPAFVAFGLSRSLLYSTAGQRVGGFVARHVRRPLPHVALRELSGDLGQARHLALVIAVTLATVLMLVVVQAGFQERTALASYAATGSLIAIVPNGDPFQGGISSADYQRVADLPGVATVIGVVQGQGRVAGREAIMVAFDWETYRRVVPVPTGFLAKGGLAPAPRGNPIPLVVSGATAQLVGADPGSALDVTPAPPLGTGSTTIQATVSGIARCLPGLFAYGDNVPALAFLPLSALSLDPSTLSYSRLLVQTVPGTGEGTLAALSNLFAWRATVVSPTAATQAYLDSSFADVTLAFMVGESWMVLGVAIVGVATVVTLQLLARTRVMASMAYRGMDHRQMVYFLVVQTLYIFALAYGVGVLTGLVAGFGFAQALMNSNPVAPFTVPPGLAFDQLFLAALPATLILLSLALQLFLSARVLRGLGARSWGAVP